MYKITVLIQTKQKFFKIPKIKTVKKMSRQRSYLTSSHNQASIYELFYSHLHTAFTN
jgi:hypothetical protein